MLVRTGRGQIGDRHRAVAEVLRDAGYRTGYYGKWHVYGGDRNRGIPPGPFRYGFDHEFLTNNCTLVFDAARAYYWGDCSRNHNRVRRSARCCEVK